MQYLIKSEIYNEFLEVLESEDINQGKIEEFLIKMSLASGNAFTLALELGWTNKHTIQPLIMKAYNNAFITATEQGIVNKETIKNLISKANSQMLAFKNKTSS